jgi:hypothetical protein
VNGHKQRAAASVNYILGSVASSLGAFARCFVRSNQALAFSSFSPLGLVILILSIVKEDL